ncbi:MAG: hypothetical protein JWO10_64, partial [Microbacteriaceae bacterium]|nr:hypothetical protein [Microbacteriaceae bacterium]
SHIVLAGLDATTMSSLSAERDQISKDLTGPLPVQPTATK